MTELPTRPRTRDRHRPTTPQNGSVPDKGLGRLLGNSAAMLKVFGDIKTIAASQERVLLCGETGVGKSMAAYEIHDHSRHRTGPYVTLNCAGFDNDLIERELFGHVKGAFTGAIESKKGLFEAADGGTLLLDEASSMSPRLQGRLLNVLESGTIRRIGTARPLPIDVRILAAVQQNLWQGVEKGTFREDLFWRLAVGIIFLPPLREHREDIPLLAEHFARCCVSPSLAYGDEEPLRFTDGALELLMAAEWPGNVRQLEYMVHRINLRCADRSTPVDRRIVDEEFNVFRPAGKHQLPQTSRGLCTLAEMERQHISRALKVAGGNTTRASELLEIGRSTLYRKLQEYELSDSELPSPEESVGPSYLFG